jgi:hypothetical protein
LNHAKDCIVSLGVGARGECIHFANINGLGRADYIDVFPTTSRANVYYNVCPSTPSTPDKGGDAPGGGTIELPDWAHATCDDVGTYNPHSALLNEIEYYHQSPLQQLIGSSKLPQIVCPKSVGSWVN